TTTPSPGSSAATCCGRGRRSRPAPPRAEGRAPAHARGLLPTDGYPGAGSRDGQEAAGGITGCHPERSEGAVVEQKQIPRCARDDRYFLTAAFDHGPLMTAFDERPWVVCRDREPGADPPGWEKHHEKAPLARGFRFTPAVRRLLLDDGLLRHGLLRRRLGHGPGRGLLRHRGRGRARGLLGHLRTGVAVAGVVALALGGLAVALAHLVLLDSGLLECRSRRARGAEFYHAQGLLLSPEPSGAKPPESGGVPKGRGVEARSGARNARSGFWD